MDRNERTAHLIKELNLYKRYPERRGIFVKATCDYYDAVKIDELTSSDLNFLRYVANEARFPQYYQLLENKYQAGKTINKESMNLLSMSSFLNEATLIVKDDMLHKYQKAVASVRYRLQLSVLKTISFSVLSAKYDHSFRYSIFEVASEYLQQR